MATKPSFRSAFKARRCLVLADGFFEWQREGKQKLPYYIRLRTGEPFAFAGLWERWDRNGLELHTCTIITTEANEVMRPVHDRMPVILQGDEMDDWLDIGRGLGETLLRPLPSTELTLLRVSDLVNRAANDSPQCIEPVVPATSGRLFE